MVTKPIEPAKMGRPLKYKSADELEQAIDKYFDECEKKGLPYTTCGLALALDIDRRTLVNYGNNEEFFPTIKKARTKIENFIETGYLTGSLNPTAAIFNLKNNYGWVDKQEIDANVDSKVEIVVDTND